MNSLSVDRLGKQISTGTISTKPLLFNVCGRNNPFLVTKSTRVYIFYAPALKSRHRQDPLGTAGSGNGRPLICKLGVNCAGGPLNANAAGRIEMVTMKMSRDVHHVLTTLILPVSRGPFPT